MKLPGLTDPRAFNAIRHSVIRSATPCSTNKFWARCKYRPKIRAYALFIYSRYCSLGGTLRAAEPVLLINLVRLHHVNAAQWNLLLEATGLWMYALVGVEEVV